jgi:hypothetical protein
MSTAQEMETLIELGRKIHSGLYVYCSGDGNSDRVLKGRKFTVGCILLRR